MSRSNISMLEKRISRLERLEKLLSRPRRKQSLNKRSVSRRKFESYESDIDEASARVEANELAIEFGRMTGTKLMLDKSQGIIDSPKFGLNNNLNYMADDPDAKFSFPYTVRGTDGAITVRIWPSNKTICVWQDYTDEFPAEGAVDPKTGDCHFVDDLASRAYPLSSWRNFDFDMLRD